MEYAKLTREKFESYLKSGRYNSATGARRAIGKTDWPQRAKNSAHAVVTAYFNPVPIQQRSTMARTVTPFDPRLVKCQIDKLTGAIVLDAAGKPEPEAIIDKNQWVCCFVDDPGKAPRVGYVDGVRCKGYTTVMDSKGVAHSVLTSELVKTHFRLPKSSGVALDGWMGSDEAFKKAACRKLAQLTAAWEAWFKMVTPPGPFDPPPAPAPAVEQAEGQPEVSNALHVATTSFMALNLKDKRQFLHKAVDTLLDSMTAAMAARFMPPAEYAQPPREGLTPDNAPRDAAKLSTYAPHVLKLLSDRVLTPEEKQTWFMQRTPEGRVGLIVEALRRWDEPKRAASNGDATHI